MKHDFLPEVVKLGHKEEMLVIGYFCVGANPKWAVEHPDLSYGKPTTYHIPGSTCSRMRGGLKKADMLILIGVTYNNLQERKQHVHELTLPCIRGAWLQAQED